VERSRDSSVGTVSRLCAALQGQEILFSVTCRPTVGVHPASYIMATRVPFCERNGRRANLTTHLSRLLSVCVNICVSACGTAPDRFQTAGFTIGSFHWAHKVNEECMAKLAVRESTPQYKKLLLFEHRPYEAWFPSYDLRKTKKMLKVSTLTFEA